MTGNMAVPTATSYQPWGVLPLPVQQTCFQIYGTKRKATNTEGACNAQITTTGKRFCFQPMTGFEHQDIHPDHVQPFPNIPTNQNETWTSASQSDCTIEDPPQRADFECHSLPINETFNVLHSTMHSESIMNDLHSSDHPLPPNTDGTQYVQRLLEENAQNQLNAPVEADFESNDYWDVPQDHHLLRMADEVEQSRIAMETDNILTHHQHSCLSSVESTLIPGLQVQNTGSHIRCYCKPTWEGLLEPTSYI